MQLRDSLLIRELRVRRRVKTAHRPGRRQRRTDLPRALERNVSNPQRIIAIDKDAMAILVRPRCAAPDDLKPNENVLTVHSANAPTRSAAMPQSWRWTVCVMRNCRE